MSDQPIRSLTWDGDEPIRVNKWLAQSGVCSRRDAESLILAGRVKVDGATVNEPGRKIEPGQRLDLMPGVASRSDAPVTVMVNKPAGVVSAHPNPGETPAVMLLVARASADEDGEDLSGLSLAPLGRLDQDSRGLLLLSSDGVLAKALIGPESPVEKEYVVEVDGQITPDRLRRLRSGLTLDGRALRRAIVQQLGDGRIRFVLQEGRNRQIRRMCEAVGLYVLDLQRVRVGALRLDGLAEGKWRKLTAIERQALLDQG